tara:strand:- start:991 stop:1719 length:729 start_codon:yes stop_codon:yes gene_type:complete
MVESVPMANGKGHRKPTLRDARKHGWVCGVTTIIKVMHAEQLVRWRINQHILAALTLDRQPEESDDAYLRRVADDAATHGRDAAEEGTRIHEALERHYRGETYDRTYSAHVDAVSGLIESHCGPDAAWLPEGGVTHPMGYGTKADLVSEKAGWLVDFKGKDFSSATVPTKTYESHAMQLAATRACIAPELRCAIVYVSRDNPGLASFVEVPEPELKQGMAMFRGLLATWQAKTGHSPWEGAV